VEALLGAVRTAKEAAEGKRLRFEAERWRTILERVLALWKRRLFPPLSESV
jgi:hypothetical protein